MVTTGEAFNSQTLPTLCLATPAAQPKGGLTFEEEVGVVLEGAVGLLHEWEVGVLSSTGASSRAPGLRDELASELEHQAEDAMDDVHDWCCLLCQ